MSVVALNFEQNPTFGPLPDKYIRKVTNILALDLPLELVGAVSGRKGACRQGSVVKCKQGKHMHHANARAHRHVNKQTVHLT